VIAWRTSTGAESQEGNARDKCVPAPVGSTLTGGDESAMNQAGIFKADATKKAGALRARTPGRIATRPPSLALYLKEADFVTLHARYLLAGSLRQLAAHTVSIFLHGMHVFFARPEGYRKRLASLAVVEDDSPSKSRICLPGWLDLLSEVAQSFVYLVGGPSKILTLACTASLLFDPPREPGGSSLVTTVGMMPPKDAWRIPQTGDSHGGKVKGRGERS
jgi:hypothetical protein